MGLLGYRYIGVDTDINLAENLLYDHTVSVVILGGLIKTINDKGLNFEIDGSFNISLLWTFLYRDLRIEKTSYYDYEFGCSYTFSTLPLDFSSGYGVFHFRKPYQKYDTSYGFNQECWESTMSGFFFKAVYSFR